MYNISLLPTSQFQYGFRTLQREHVDLAESRPVGAQICVVSIVVHIVYDGLSDLVRVSLVSVVHFSRPFDVRAVIYEVDLCMFIVEKSYYGDKLS